MEKMDADAYKKVLLYNDEDNLARKIRTKNGKIYIQLHDEIIPHLKFKTQTKKTFEKQLRYKK